MAFCQRILLFIQKIAEIIITVHTRLKMGIQKCLEIHSMTTMYIFMLLTFSHDNNYQL